MSLVILNGSTNNDAAWIETSFAAAQQPTGAISLSCWFKRTASAQNFPALFTLWNTGSGDDSWQIYIGFGGNDEVEQTLAVEFNGGNDTTDNFYTLNVWHHVAVTWDGVNVNIYLDAVLVGGPNAFAGPIVYSGADVFEIGASNAHDGSVNGPAADARIYNRGLSAKEVKELFQARGADSIVQGLVGRYIGNEGAVGVVGGAGSIKDISKTKNNGTPTKDPGAVDNVKWSTDVIKYKRKAI